MDFLIGVVRTVFSSVLAAMFAINSPPMVPSAEAQETITNEYAVKANIVRSILSFVEWPADALSADGREDLKICVLGANPFGRELELAIEGQTVDERAIILWEARRIDAIGFCHLLFISSSEADRLSQIFHALEDLPVLTISDIDGFAEHGGMVAIELVDRKNRLVVNRSALGRSDLKLSSRLLRLARLVTNDLSAVER